MKKWLLSYFLICLIQVMHGQNLDNSSIRIPNSQTYSSTAIADYVQANCSTDQQKIGAAYNWVITNIRYDKDSMYNINWSPDPQLKVTAALRRKKGVCENFAAVFTDILLKLNIPSFIVNGYTTQTKAGHSWSVVRLNNEWLFCDPTWDIGAANNTRYFLITPDKFINSHMPFDPLWQLLPYPITQAQFSRGNYYSLTKERIAVSVDDSVKAFFKLDSLQQLEASSLRMKQAGLQFNGANIWHGYINMKIAIEYGDKDMNLYNGAVADLNKANAIFNNYVQYRNNEFMPLKSDATISGLLDNIPAIISSAFKQLKKIGQKMPDDQYDTSILNSKLNTLSARVLEQQKFLKRYLESTIAERGKLFYNFK